jgi:hypothetical protein
MMVESKAQFVKPKTRDVTGIGFGYNAAMSLAKRVHVSI